MKRIFLFSDSFRTLWRKVGLASLIAVRFILVLFKGRKDIEPVEFEYSTKHLFDKSYLILRYHFRNALWYRFEGLISTARSGRVAFNMSKISGPVRLVVYGFFRRREFLIDARPELTLHSGAFKATLLQFNQVRRESLRLNHGVFQIRPALRKPVVVNDTIIRGHEFSLWIKLNAIRIVHRKVKFHYSSFIQNDYLW